MRCPRLEHFVRPSANGKIGRCGHMIRAPEFDSYNDLENSEWLASVKQQMSEDTWPQECIRCQDTENNNNESIRQQAIKRDRILKTINPDYLIVGGVLDNVCNSACFSCNATLSTKIGALENGKDYLKYDNYELFKTIPQDRIVELDINGGEPTASKTYQRVLEELPDSVKIVRINTNGSRYFSTIDTLLDRGITVIITLSLDGIGEVHDYARWPIKWNNYNKVVDQYAEKREKHRNLKLDFWTTVSVLNVLDFQNIRSYATKMQIPHSYAFLKEPAALNIEYTNTTTLQAKHLFPLAATKEDNTEQLEKYLEYNNRIRRL